MNKNFIVFLSVFCALLFHACHTSAPEREPEAIHDMSIQSGDLLFVGIPLDYRLSDSTVVDSATPTSTAGVQEVNYIHVAILELDEHDSLWVIDATIKHGVSRYPFREFLSDFTLKNGEYPRLEVMRLKDNKLANRYVEQAKSYVGRDYDIHFSADNTEQYCSELVRNAYKTDRGEYIFSEGPMDFKSADGTVPPYWVELFALLGAPVPQGVTGTTPNAMYREHCLVGVGQLP
ncbi:MAG: hypothetical protein J5642_08370 [Bacteroidales bacterium]|nr:hypothetical protein [Bacteroidales bacterium]